MVNKLFIKASQISNKHLIRKTFGSSGCEKSPSSQRDFSQPGNPNVDLLGFKALISNSLTTKKQQH